MPFAFYAIAFAVLGAVMTGAITHYLANRPEKYDPYDPEDIQDELSSAFAERRSIELTTSVEYAPQLLARIARTVDHGFTERHEDMLRHRLETQQTPTGPRVARYSVEVNDDSGDLEVRWLRISRDQLHLRFEAPIAVIEAIEAESKRMPATVNA